MQTLNSYVNLSTTVIALGLTILSVNPAQASSWFRTVTAGEDTYSDTQPGNEDVNFGEEDFIRVGNFPNGTFDANGPVPNPEEQRGYLSWDLQSIINDINNSVEITQGTQIRNLNARLILQQSPNDPLNPNDPNRPFPGFARVTLDGLGVTGSWDESQGINPNNPPSTINNPTLFSGQITPGRNIYSGSRLNTYIQDILNTNFNRNANDNEDILSIALRPNASLNLPNFGLFPIDSFWSQNQDNEALKPQLELEFEVWNEAYKIVGGPNVTVQSRLGNFTSWEWALSTKGQDNRGNTRDTVVTNTDWIWENGEAVQFELECNPNNNRLSLRVGDQDPISYITDTCEGMDGVSMFAQARAENTEMEIELTRIGELGEDSVDMTDRDVNALGVQADDPRAQPLRFYFTDESNPLAPNGGGLDFMDGANFIQGLVTMRWDEEDGSPQGDPAVADNANQIQLTALTRADDPEAGLTPQGFNPQGNEPQSSIFEAACVDGTPDLEIWGLIESSNPEMLPEYNCSSNQISSNNTTVPEPTSVLSLMLLGASSLGLKLRRR